MALHPTVISGNASEILALQEWAKGGKGSTVPTLSDAALEASVKLAREYNTIVCVTGKTDYATDGKEILSCTGGPVKATLVVGTGCSLSAMVAAFVAQTEHIYNSLVWEFLIEKSKYQL